MNYEVLCTTFLANNPGVGGFFYQPELLAATILGT